MLVRNPRAIFEAHEEGVRRLALVAVLLVELAAFVARAEATGSALAGLEPYDELMTGSDQEVGRRRRRACCRLQGQAAPGAGLRARQQGARRSRWSRPACSASASLSKTITAVAVLQLVQGGRLKLDDKVLPILGDIGPRPDRITDPRVHDITVRHLLQHSGGFDRDRSGDVVFLPDAAEAARRQGGPLPPDCPTIMRDTLERKLDFAPGERFAYSNIGYCVLGRVIERVTGAPYEAHVRQHVLAPIGAARMKVGRTLQPAEGEVTYYDYRGAKEVRAMPGLGLTFAPQPYGAFAVETMDSYGGWIGSPVDYLRFIARDRRPARRGAAEHRDPGRDERALRA